MELIEAFFFLINYYILILPSIDVNLITKGYNEFLASAPLAASLLGPHE